MAPVVRHEGESAEIICPYDSIYKSKPKSLYISFMYSLSLYVLLSGFSMIIIISVCVILLLIGGFTLTVWKLRHERQGDAHSQLPTIPSDGLLYAAVSFQKHEESLSDATVRFSKNEIHSDYTAVSHLMRLN